MTSGEFAPLAPVGGADALLVIRKMREELRYCNHILNFNRKASCMTGEDEWGKVHCPRCTSPATRRPNGINIGWIMTIFMRRTPVQKSRFRSSSRRRTSRGCSTWGMS